MRVFFPIRHIDVPASPPHDPGTAYRVSCGVEHWGPEPTYVYKVQIARGGVVSGRRSPSFPAGADDFERVCRAMAELRRSSDGGHRNCAPAHPKQNAVEEPVL
jgi:hypothetical protein